MIPNDLDLLYCPNSFQSNMECKKKKKDKKVLTLLFSPNIMVLVQQTKDNSLYEEQNSLHKEYV